MRKTGATPGETTETLELDSFYGRWSRRKQQARGAVPATTEAAVADPGAAAAGATPPPAPPAPQLTDADMPPLESLNEDSDYSGFLSTGVSEALRNKALRKLFLSPQFNIVDGLDDYCEDFTNFEVLGDIVTADMEYEREYEARRILEREQQQQEQGQQQEQAQRGVPGTDPATLKADQAESAKAPAGDVEEDESAEPDLESGQNPEDSTVTDRAQEQSGESRQTVAGSAQIATDGGDGSQS